MVLPVVSQQAPSRYWPICGHPNLVWRVHRKVVLMVLDVLELVYGNEVLEGTLGSLSADIPIEEDSHPAWRHSLKIECCLGV